MSSESKATINDAPNVTETVADLLAKFALTDAEVGRLIGVPASAVRNLHRLDKRMKALKIAGRLVWRPVDVAAYVEALEVDG